jgi:hypothetical protein
MAWRTPDGSWRVDVVKRRGTQWFRLARRDPHRVWEPLTIATVERLLREHGVDLAELREVDAAA